MIRALLVDDEGPARARLRALLDEVGGVTVVGEAANADDARLAISTLTPDVVFLDIEMPGERGMDLAASLPEPRPFVVFATAYERFAIDAFQHEAVDYLLKPVNRTRLGAAIARMQDKVQQRRDAARELAAAERAQAHLLPRSLPEAPGFALAARTLAARGVGGDFYDAVRLHDRIAFVLGDVAGKGMAAGLVASSVQARWQSAIRQEDLTAAGLFAALNRDVLATTEGNRYATLVHGVLDTASGVLHYVNAGHPAAVIAHADGSWSTGLDATAPAVGLFDGAAFVSASCTLAPGDTVVVMSDGVTEACDAHGVELPMARVADTVTGNSGADAATLAERVVALVRAHRGADQTQDDVTVLVLRRTA